MGEVLDIDVVTMAWVFVWEGAGYLGWRGFSGVQWLSTIESGTTVLYTKGSESSCCLVASNHMFFTNLSVVRGITYGAEAVGLEKLIYKGI